MSDVANRAASLLQRLHDQGVGFLAPGVEFNVFGLSLAQGLKDLGIPCFGRLPNWPKDRGGACPLVAAPDRFASAALLLVDIGGLPTQRNHIAPKILEDIRALGSERLVFLMDVDDATNRITPTDIPTLVAHENRFFEIDGWRIPWCFGLMPTTLGNIDKAAPGPRTDTISRSFTPSLNQGLRDHLDVALLPRLREHRPIDQTIDTAAGRVQVPYMRRLQESDICLAYGGQFMPDISKNLALKESQAALLDHARFHDSPVLFRWDSWRFWESLACGAVTVHVDLEKYGCRLPVMPTNWVHYVGLDLSNLERDIDRLLSPDTDRRAIGEAGRAWVIRHYSPTAQAFRLLATLSLSGRWE